MVGHIKTIMIIDDEPGVVNQIRSSLNTEEFTVLTASNSREAMELLQNTDEHSVDLFLINTRVPDSEKQALFSLRPMSKMVITTEPNDFLVKPFTVEQLHDFLKTKMI